MRGASLFVLATWSLGGLLNVAALVAQTPAPATTKPSPAAPTRSTAAQPPPSSSTASSSTPSSAAKQPPAPPAGSSQAAKAAEGEAFTKEQLEQLVAPMAASASWCA